MPFTGLTEGHAAHSKRRRASDTRNKAPHSLAIAPQKSAVRRIDVQSQVSPQSQCSAPYRSNTNRAIR